MTAPPPLAAGLARALAIVLLPALALLPVLPAAGAGPAPPEIAPMVDREIDSPYNGGSPFYPTGRYFWITHPAGFGFPSDVHVVHWNQLSAIEVDVRWDGREVKPAEGRVHASRLELDAAAPGLAVHEAKMLTPDDALVSLLTFRASAAGTLEVKARSPLAPRARPDGSAAGKDTLHAIPLAFVFRASAPATGREVRIQRRLAAGETTDLRLVLAAAPTEAEADDVARRALAEPDPVAAAAARTERWFVEKAPGFDCPDPYVRRAFLYRLLTVKKTLMDPRAGRIRTIAAAEGRWAARWYPALITFGAGHQLAEMRWLRDASIPWGHLQALAANQRGDGAFLGARTDAALTAYTDFVGFGAHDLYLATGDRQRFASFARSLARAADHALAEDCDGDFVPGPTDHWTSGMEWQPSYFAFDGYHPGKETRLERVEAACFQHGNALAAARALELAGGSGARYREIARRTAAAVEGELWDQAARFYFSRRERDHARAPDREVGGFYPPAFGITAADRLPYLRDVASPDRWAAPFPVPSVEMDSPGFAYDKKWPVGPGGGSASMWNGPTWPHAQSFVIRSLAVGERAGAVPRGTAFRLLDRYARVHFYGVGEERRIDLPQVSESYDPFRGVWLSNEREYFHSTFVDLVVTVVAGVQPAEGDTLRLDPLVPPGLWDRFALVRLPYHGRTLAVVWDAPDGRDEYGDGVEGLVVWVDGAIAARRPDLGPLDVPLGPSR